jgi:hypothetical protein
MINSNTFFDCMNKSSIFVKKCGLLTPYGVKTLRQCLTIKDISIWDILAPHLALYRVQKVLERSYRESFGENFIYMLRKIKYYLYKNLRWIQGNRNASECLIWPSGEVALFLGFSAYLARDVLLPIAEEIYEKCEIKPVVLCDKNTTFFEGKKVFSHLLLRHFTSAVASDAQKFSKIAKQTINALAKNKLSQEILEVDGSRINCLMRKDVLDFGAVYLPEIVAIARHILAVHRPSIIVSIDVADPRTRVFTQIAKSMAIPTLQIQAGPIDQGCVEWRFLEDDVVAVQGIDAKEELILHGVPIEKIVITGSPRYDGLVGASSIERINLRKRFNIPLGNKVVVLASVYSSVDAFGSDSVAVSWAMKMAIFKTVASIPGISLIVKPHPLEDNAQARAFCDGIKTISFAHSNESITDYIRACDAFLSFGSTATYEAICLAKPTGCLSFPGWNFAGPFLGSGAVIDLLSESDVIEMLKEVVGDGGDAMLKRTSIERINFLNRMIRDGGHGANQRIIDLIISMTTSVGTMK